MKHTLFRRTLLNICAVNLWILFLCFTSGEASLGDNNVYYERCVDECLSENCTSDGDLFLFSVETSFFVDYLWSCRDDCRYHCMWGTVKLYSERSWGVPQFYGKWPFVRIFGLQEPASVLFSIFNFLAHILMIQKFHYEVRRTSPMYWLWHVYSMVCLNGWFWSAIFHARDVPFTEKMDYFCAFSMVLFSFYCMILRLLQGRYFFIHIVMTIFCILFFIHHVTYLGLVHLDYSYNMMANLSVGAITTLGWLIWCFRVYKPQPYVWRCAAFFILTAFSVCFEVFDFPPILWLIDAHSLFHLSTAALPILLYRFAIDDCKYLHKQLELERDETFTKKRK